MNQPTVSGEVALALRVSGPAMQPSADLTLTCIDGRFQQHSLDTLKAAVSLSDREARLTSLELSGPFGSLSAAARADLTPVFPDGWTSPGPDWSRLTCELSARIHDLDLARILPPAAGMAGHVSGELAAAGTGITVTGINTNLKLSLAARDLKTPGMTDPARQVSLNASAAITQGRVNLDPLILDMDGTRLSARGAYQIDSMETETDIQIRIPELSALLDRFGIPGGAGELDLAGHIAGPALHPAVHLDLAGKRMAWQGTRLGQVSLNADLTPDGEVRISPLAIENQSSRIRLSGSLSLFQNGFTRHPSLPADMTLTLDPLRPADFLPDLGLKGEMSGDATLTGPVMNPRILARLSGKDLGYQQWRIGNLQTALGLSEGTLAIEKLAVSHPDAGIGISGKAEVLGPGFAPLKDPTFALAFSGQAGALKRFHPSLAGRLDLKGKATGRLSAPQAEIALNGRDLAYDQTRIGDIDARISLKDGTLSFAPFKIVNRESTLTLTGNAQVLSSGNAVNADPPLALTLSGATIRIPDFMPDFKGALSLDGRVTGRASNPKGHLNVNGQNLKIAGQDIRNINLKVGLGDRRAWTDSLLVDLGQDARIQGSGEYGLDRSEYRFDLAAPAFSLAAIRAIPENVIGRAAISLTGSGTVAAPRVTGSIALSGLHVDKRPLPDCRIDLNLDRDIFQAAGDPGFGVAASYHLKTHEVKADLRFDGTDLTPFFRLADQPDLSGRLAGNIAVTGDVRKIGDLEAAMNIQDLDIAMAGRPLIRVPGLRALLSKGSFAIENTEIRLLEQGKITLTGTGRVGGDIDIRVNGDIPVLVLDPFLDAVSNITGTLRLDARLTGSAPAPQIQADILLDGLGMSVLALDQSLHDITGHIRIQPREAVIEKLDGQLDEGRFTLGGTIGLAGLRPDRIDLNWNAHQMPIQVPDTLDLTLNSQFHLTGEKGKSRIDGEVVLLEGRYYKDVALNLLEMTEKKRGQIVTIPSQTSKNPLLENMALSIRVKRRDPLTIENNLADMSLSPQFQIIGTAARPAISGRIQIDEGMISFRKRDFEIQQGIIDFVNPYQIQPELDIRAESQIRDWLVTLDISGTPDNLQFDLTSDPREEHGDILSLIIIGKTTKELMGKGGSGTSPKQLVANILAEALGKRLKDATGLDEVKIAVADEGGNQNDSDVKVTLGKDLSRRIAVKYGAETRQGETIHTVTTEYKILEKLLISAFQDTRGDFGGALHYRMEFR